jgi:hypothetical protein
MVEHLLSADVQVLVSRAVLTAFASEIGAIANNEAYREVRGAFSVAS